MVRAMTPPDCSQWDAAADAILKLWKGGGVQLAAFITVIVGIVYNPWAIRARKENK